MKSVLPTLTFIFAATALIAQDVPINWVHGLGGTGETWDIYRDIIDAQRASDGSTLAYTEANGMAAFAGEVVLQTQSLSAANGNAPAIGVGHSLGGIALRDAAIADPGSFRGVITVGSPNRGGAIVESVASGRVRRELEYACRQLAAGPSTELPALFTSVKVNSGLTEEIWTNNQLCEAAYDAFIGPGVNGLADGASAQDIRPAAPYLTALNSAPQGSPTISIRGEENAPVQWRLASSLRSGNRNDNSISKAVQLTENVYQVMHGIKVTNTVVNVIFSIVTPNPKTIIAAALNGYQAVQWNRGRLWFKEVDYRYLELIDCIPGTESRVVETRRVRTDYMCNEKYSTGSKEWIECVSQNPCGEPTCWEDVEIRQTFAIRGSSDGFFCAEAQLVEGLAEENVYVAQGVNHSEETNTTFMNTANGNDEMQRIFNEILTGDATSPFFFP